MAGYLEFMGEYKFTNSLIQETSPYLLQHAHNPVQWFPWGPEALAKARSEDKPILLSIGYSACHWCHVMAHESFEDEEIAALMNQNFINIKVDREERPDLDAIYMAAVQLVTGRGGWPMTVFLTPDQQPFYCGTYFPKEDRYGVPGFRRILEGVALAYRENKSTLCREAETLTAAIRRSNSPDNSAQELTPAILEKGALAIASGYDPANGGFGEAPKFPPSMALSFLMRSALGNEKDRYLEIIHHTLRKMACGGIYDQLGGGFHRYSVDAQWLTPHFEKMLYDNALLSRLYLDAFLLTGEDFYRRICGEILDYVRREMTSEEGGFYSSQDADSEGREGEFFIWTEQEIRSLIGAEDASLFCRYHGVTPEGNFEGRNILHVPMPSPAFARENGLSEEALTQVLQRCRAILFDAREKRPRPGRDEKALTAWNGLMLRSFAEAAKALKREDYRETAIRNAEFLLDRMRCNGNLLRSYKDGRSKFNGYLEDYACLVDALLSLYEATFNLRWIREAEQLAESMVHRFWDPESREFFFTPEDHESLIHRPKDFYDNATPSGNSAAAWALLKLAKFTGKDSWTRYAVGVLENEAGLMQQHPAAVPHLLCALDFLLRGARAITIVGESHSEGVQNLLAEVFCRFLPNAVVACGQNGDMALLANRPQLNGLATAYVCENSVCLPPVTSPDELRRILS